MPPIKPPYFGAAYYPEHWSDSDMDHDIQLMVEVGMNAMRMGEFAWSRMETSDSVFDFDWLHKAVDRLGKAGIASILGTPTATPPLWLVEKHSEVLGVYPSGLRAQHGGRRHPCLNSPVFREHSRRITQKLAEEFGSNTNVIGWQLDNEIVTLPPNGCYCDYCRSAFHAWLEKRSSTIELLNQKWCTTLFSQEYSRFHQIPAPRPDTWHHPSLWVAWELFQGDSTIEFLKEQVEILHNTASQPVGTDMMPSTELSHKKVNKMLDVVQFNHYNFMDNLWKVGFWMDLCRTTIPAKKWWVTETSTCWHGATFAKGGYRDPGFCRASSWLSFALGAEANLYWLWRSHWAGQELMHGSVISSTGRPMHVFDEVKQIATDLKTSAGFLQNTSPDQPQVAVVYSSLAGRIFNGQPMTSLIKNYPEPVIENVYRPLLEEHIRVDCIEPDSSLDPYRVIFCQFLPAFDEAGFAPKVLEWINQGGVLVAGPLSDNRTLDATKFRHAPFGYLETWSGASCKYQIPGEPSDFTFAGTDGVCQCGSLWYDGFEPGSSQTVATYVDGPLTGLAAIVEKNIGKGKLILLGTMLRKPEMRAFAKSLCDKLGIQKAAHASDNVLVVPRSGPGGNGSVVVELFNREGSLTLETPSVNLLTGKTLAGMIPIAPYEVIVLKE